MRVPILEEVSSSMNCICCSYYINLLMIVELLYEECELLGQLVDQ